jgi:hypothetical protein
MSIRLLSLFVILIHPSPAYWGQTGVIQSQPAQFSPRSVTPDSAGGIYGPVGMCAVGDAIAVSGNAFICQADIWEEVYHPNPHFMWS